METKPTKDNELRLKIYNMLNFVWFDPSAGKVWREFLYSICAAGGWAGSLQIIKNNGGKRPYVYYYNDRLKSMCAVPSSTHPNICDKKDVMELSPDFIELAGCSIQTRNEYKEVIQKNIDEKNKDDAGPGLIMSGLCFVPRGIIKTGKGNIGLTTFSDTVNEELKQFQERFIDTDYFKKEVLSDKYAYIENQAARLKLDYRDVIKHGYYRGMAFVANFINNLCYQLIEKQNVAFVSRSDDLSLAEKLEAVKKHLEGGIKLLLKGYHFRNLQVEKLAEYQPRNLVEERCVELLENLNNMGPLPFKNAKFETGARTAKKKLKEYIDTNGFDTWSGSGTKASAGKINILVEILNTHSKSLNKMLNFKKNNRNKIFKQEAYKTIRNINLVVAEISLGKRYLTEWYQSDIRTTSYQNDLQLKKAEAGLIKGFVGFINWMDDFKVYDDKWLKNVNAGISMPLINAIKAGNIDSFVKQICAPIDSKLAEIAKIENLKLAREKRNAELREMIKYEQIQRQEIEINEKHNDRILIGLLTKKHSMFIGEDGSKKDYAIYLDKINNILANKEKILFSIATGELKNKISAFKNIFNHTAENLLKFKNIGLLSDKEEKLIKGYILRTQKEEGQKANEVLNEAGYLAEDVAEKISELETLFSKNVGFKLVTDDIKQYSRIFNANNVEKARAVYFDKLRTHKKKLDDAYSEIITVLSSYDDTYFTSFNHLAESKSVDTTVNLFKKQTETLELATLDKQRVYEAGVSVMDGTHLKTFYDRHERIDLQFEIDKNRIKTEKQRLNQQIKTTKLNILNKKHYIDDYKNLYENLDSEDVYVLKKKGSLYECYKKTTESNVKAACCFEVARVREVTKARNVREEITIGKNNAELLTTLLELHINKYELEIENNKNDVFALKKQILKAGVDLESILKHMKNKQNVFKGLLIKDYSKIPHIKDGLAMLGGELKRQPKEKLEEYKKAICDGLETCETFEIKEEDLQGYKPKTKEIKDVLMDTTIRKAKDLI